MTWASVGDEGHFVRHGESRISQAREQAAGMLMPPYFHVGMKPLASR